MSNHTPHPWFCDQKLTICYWPQHGGWAPVPPTIENRTLQAAAPDLLEAIEQCLRFIQGDEMMHGRNFAAGNVARNAIKKATGFRPPEVV